MSKRHLPVAGILCSLCLFVVAAAHYPGGTVESAQTVGHDWAHNFISTLFSKQALNGADNQARPFALPAMLLFCTSSGMMFRAVSMQSTSAALKHAINIGGIGSMVYAFLAVATPMHDLLVTVSLGFSLVAIVAMLCMLYLARRTTLFVVGVICLAVLVTAAVMYYGNVRWRLLPITHKLVFVLVTGWLLTLYLANAAATRPVLPGGSPRA